MIGIITPIIAQILATAWIRLARILRMANMTASSHAHPFAMKRPIAIIISIIPTIMKIKPIISPIGPNPAIARTEPPTIPPKRAKSPIII